MGLYENAREVLLDALAFYAYKVAPGEKVFRLSSGLSSSVVVDASLAVRFPNVFRVLPSLLHRHLPNDGMFNVVGGPSNGADPLCAATLSARNVRWCSVRREPKDHGCDTGVVTGPVAEGDRVVVMDDVLTTGASIVRAVEAFKKAGCVVLGVVVLVNREEYNGTTMVQSYLSPHAFLRSIFTLGDIEHCRAQWQSMA